MHGLCYFDCRQKALSGMFTLRLYTLAVPLHHGWKNFETDI